MFTSRSILATTSLMALVFAVSLTGNAFAQEGDAPALDFDKVIESAGNPSTGGPSTGGPGLPASVGGGDRDAMRAKIKEKMQSMSPEERKAFMEKRMQARGGAEGGGEFREKFKNMSREERRALFEKLPPEKQAEIKAKMEEHRAAMKEKWEAMSPEERKAFAEQHKGKGGGKFREKMQNMSPEERKAFMQEHPEIGNKIRERMEQRGGEGGGKFRERMQQRGGEGGGFLGRGDRKAMPAPVTPPVELPATQ